MFYGEPDFFLEVRKVSICDNFVSQKTEIQTLVCINKNAIRF